MGSQYAVNFTNVVKAERLADKDSKIPAIPNDGTLATLARNNWSEEAGSTWPCSKKRPFCLVRRKLDTEGVEKKGEKEREKEG